MTFPASAQAVDLHQHLWPEPLVDRLRARSRVPYLRGWTLHTLGEAPYEIDARHHDVPSRRQQNADDGIGLACLSLSAPLGIEGLRGPSARALLDTWHQGAEGLPAGFAAWASVPRLEPDVEGLRGLLAGGFVGVQLPATDVRTPSGWARVAPVLDAADRAGKPVLVHPGPEPPNPDHAELPAWWPAVVGYAAQLQAAWWAWHAADVRASHPGLRVVFAAGAGLAPVHHERYVARGGTHSPGGPDGARRHLVVRTPGPGRAGPGPRDRRTRAGQRPPVRRTGRRADGRGGHPRRARDQPAPGPRPDGDRARGGAVMAAGELTTDLVAAEGAVDYRDDVRLIGLDTSPGGISMPRELRDLVSSLARDPDRWAHLVGFDDEERVYASLHRDAHVDVWLLCWTPVNDTGWHDHDISSGAVAVVAGELVENNLRVGSAGVETRVPAGHAFSFGPDHIHRLNGAERGTVSVHAYSPPLWRLGQYAVSDSGVLRRASVSYADELRPLE